MPGGEHHHVLVVMASAADLQWTTMGLLSVLRCTLLTSSITVMMVCSRVLELLDRELQFSIWNRVTSWLLPDCDKIIHKEHCCMLYYTLSVITSILSMYPLHLPSFLHSTQSSLYFSTLEASGQY